MSRNFNPTVVRIHEKGRQVGMVINNSALDSSYFQIYELNPGGTRCTTFLEYAMPWNTCQDAIRDFDAWVNCESKDKPFEHSWCGSKEERALSFGATL